jgi:hypothetical protein
MRFEAPWDGLLKVTTALSVVLGVGLLLFASIALLPSRGALGGLIVAAAGVTQLLTWALAPKAYAIEAGTLRVERPLFPVDVPLSTIRAARPLADEAFRGSRRVAGSGGAFGYYGRFWSPRLGSFRLLATRRRELVLVDTEAERFVLSPDTPDRFLDALLSRASRAVREDPGAPLVPRPTALRTWMGIASLVALAVAVFGALVLVFRAFGS